MADEKACALLEELGFENLIETFKDARDLLLFLLIAPACPPSTHIREKGSKKQLKPTILESIDGFILNAKVPGDVKVLLNRKREKAVALGLQIQPCIIIVCNLKVIASLCHGLACKELYLNWIWCCL